MGRDLVRLMRLVPVLAVAGLDDIYELMCLVPGAAVAGLARSGAARSAPARAEGLREELKALRLHKLDVIHLMNAHFQRCPVFVTLDKEDILRRKDILERLLGLEILTPDQILVRLAQ